MVTVDSQGVKLNRRDDLDYRDHDGELGNRIFERIVAEERVKEIRGRLDGAIPLWAEELLTEYESLLIEKAFNLGRLSER